MRINPYLFFGGDCKAAFEFYEQVLGGKITAMFPFAGSPAEEHVAPEMRGGTMHAALAIGDQLFMGSDAPGHHDKPQGFSVSINVDEPAEAERIFGALAEGGKVEMPIAETFWALRFGTLTDRFGTPWMVNCSRPESAG